MGFIYAEAIRADIANVTSMTCLCRWTSRSSSDDSREIPSRFRRLYIGFAHPSPGSHRLLRARHQRCQRPALLLVILITITSCLLIALTDFTWCYF